MGGVGRSEEVPFSFALKEDPAWEPPIGLGPNLTAVVFGRTGTARSELLPVP